MTYVTQIKLAAVPGSIGARAADQFDALPLGNCAEGKTPRVGVVVKIELLQLNHGTLARFPWSMLMPHQKFSSAPRLLEDSVRSN